MTVLTPEPGAATSLVELRVLEGPNLYFPRAAVRLTLDVGVLVDLPEARLREVAGDLGLRPMRPGAAGSGFRLRAVTRVVTQLVRRLAGQAGVSRVAVRTRPASESSRLVVAYPWRDRGRAVALGCEVVAALDGLHDLAEDDRAQDLATLLRQGGVRVREAADGQGPSTVRPRVPVVAVTGTNGKTTTSRLVAHLARGAGHHVGWSSTDGIYVDGVLVEPGDYSGPSGAARVLAHREVDFAVAETARGGILLRGIGISSNDVSVVTNVSADHLGIQGIDTVDQLAEVKGVVPRITKPGGWAVLNADDPRVLAMRLTTKARPWVFSRDPDSPALRQVLGDGGRASTVIDGWITVLGGSSVDPLVELHEVPMTLGGLSRHNVENALAGASAALAARIDREHVVAGMRSFLPDAAHNPGRMNLFTLPLEPPTGSATVLVDLAHNEAGLEAMVEVMNGVRAPGGRLLLGLGAVGDRQDGLIEQLGEIAGRDADVVAIGHKTRYLRGRAPAELEALLRAGLERVGAHDVAAHPTELESLQALAAQAGPGDVVGLMCHAERQQVYDWLESVGAHADGPAELTAKVRAAHPRADPEPGPGHHSEETP